MNNPFDYTPTSAMLAEQRRLALLIETLCQESRAFAHELSQGKMFGVLITETETLYAFSGQICGSFNHPGFVPPVFDYLAPDGYFKRHEAEITQQNLRIHRLLHAPELNEARRNAEQIRIDGEKQMALMRQRMAEAKKQRDLIRRQGTGDEAAMIRESQFMKAEMHRLKLRIRQQETEAQQRIDALLLPMESLKNERQRQSEHLQQWLFSQFVFHTESGRTVSLADVEGYPTALPPSGAGECCEPKLLNYAFAHGLKPIEIGMFWWGRSPKAEVRHHLHFYPACGGKCKPLLRAMLDVSHINDETDKNGTLRSLVRVIDARPADGFIVVYKPAGLLSVPGKTSQTSLYDVIKELHLCDDPIMVHRLDQDTSGIMLVATNEDSYHVLQRQFADHTVSKTYIAILDIHNSAVSSSNGSVELPLSPDFFDRPRQRVDTTHGKPAVTHYRVIDLDELQQMFPGKIDNIQSLSVSDSEALVLLQPETGRTHQLRVHCSHVKGLNAPIKGDRLYGQRDKRLFLHAMQLSFDSPAKGLRLTYTLLPDFNEGTYGSTTSD